MNDTDARYRLPTASRLDTAEQCPGSMVLDGINTTNTDNASGTSIHDFVLVRSVEIGRDAALDEITDRTLRDRCAAIDLSRIPPGAEREVALAWNWRTGEARKVGVNIGRAYPDLGPDWFQGTIDVLGVTGYAVVAQDLKTGEQKVPAAESLQLGFAAVAGTELTGIDRAEVAMLYEGHGGRSFQDHAVLDAEDLAVMRTRLRAIAESRLVALEDVRAGRLPVLRDGPWCSLCPSQRFCPAQAALVRTAAGWGLETVAARMENLSDEEAGRAWEMLAVAEKIVEAGRRALKSRAKQAPFPLPSGKVVAEVAWGEREVFTDFAKAQFAGLEEDMRRRGECHMVPATQVRAVSAKTAQKMLEARRQAQAAAPRFLEAEQGEHPAD